MLQATRRRVGSAAWLALGLVVGLPSLAEAQLLPNRTIKRQRPDCAAEPPFNAHVRRDFYGYYPTCWSRFPAGWQCPCPNPELPNAAAEFRTAPRDKIEDRVDDRGPGPDEAGPDRMTDPAADDIAPPTRGRQPFPIEGQGDPLPRTNTLPAPDPSVPPRTTAPDPANKPSATVGLLEMPTIPPAADSSPSDLEPNRTSVSPEVTRTSNTTEPTRDLGMLPPPSSMTPAQTPSDPPMLYSSSTPAQAPQRKTILGSLFGQGTAAAVEPVSVR